jgi:hypothetical protein
MLSAARSADRSAGAPGCVVPRSKPNSAGIVKAFAGRGGHRERARALAQELLPGRVGLTAGVFYGRVSERAAFTNSVSPYGIPLR